MKIGIVGTGNMGRAIGLVLDQLGHDVFFGARNEEKAKSAAQLSCNSTRYGTNQQAAEFGNVIYFNPRDVAPSEVLADISALNGKVVFDSNNQATPENSYAPITLSVSEQLQEQIPEARVVKAFNTVAQEVFEIEPEIKRQYRIACFLAGNDPDARNIVSALASEMGFEPIDCGALLQARHLEAAGNLIRLVIRARGGDLGTTFSVPSMPLPPESRFAQRQISNLH